MDFAGGRMYSITFSSTANEEFSDAALAEICTAGRLVIPALGITGALLYRNGRFLQMLEGPEGAVRSLFAHIAADPRRAIDVAADHRTPTRRFTTWSMGYRPRITGPSSQGEVFDNCCPGPGSSHDPADDVGGDQTMFDWLYSSWLLADATQGLSELGKRTDSFYRSQRISAEVPAGAAVAVCTNATVAAPDAVSPLAESPVVSSIVNHILDEVDRGTLVPGDRVNDAELARRLGVSRTPVREAILKLRDAGIIEISANRFTRIAVVEPTAAAELIVVLMALYSAVLDEVVGTVDGKVIDAMRSDLAAFRTARHSADVPAMLRSAAALYLRLVSESCNHQLKERIHMLVRVIRLAGRHIEHLIGLDVLEESLSETLVATVAGDVLRAKRALATLGGSSQHDRSVRAVSDLA